MKNKTAQLALFTLIGIVLFVASSFIFYLNSVKAKPSTTKTLPLETYPIKSYIESCIKSVGRDAVKLIGQQGGYFNIPKYSTKEHAAKTAYYFYIDRNLMPSKNKIEQELSAYMNENLFLCFNNLADFKNMGFDMEYGLVNAASTVNQDSVSFNIDFPLKIKKDGSETNLNSFSNSVENIRLGVIYDTSKTIIGEQMKNFNNICLSCIVTLAVENDLHIGLDRMGNDTVVFTITDFNSSIDDAPYGYVFANKYQYHSCSNPPLDAPPEFLLDCLKSRIGQYNYSLNIETIPDLIAFVNTTFTYNAVATGFNITFSDFTELFEINKNAGLINFTPTESQIGDHYIWISAIDGFGNEDYETFQLNITHQNEI